MLKNPLQETTEDHRMATREGQLSRKHSLKSKSCSLHPSPVTRVWGLLVEAWPCALSLDKRGVKSSVFDTGNHGLGGRMGTRMIGPQPLIFDHAAQFSTVNDSRFCELVDGWLERGLVRPWEGAIGELEVGGQFTPFPSSPPKYIGVNRMRPLADSLLAQTSMVSVVRPCWISNLEPFNGMWHLSKNEKPRGQFDVVIFAHNAPSCNDSKMCKSVTWFIWLTQIARQMKSDAPQCWTFFSTAAYGKRNKVPQENIPTATAEKVKTGMLEGVEAALGLPKSSLQKPVYTQVQLWQDSTFTDMTL
ncbi:hypothetical protein CUMW_168690 [Citrus unshiu]|uniref:Amine oxidase domain-containing protein n=1 Tax=Citrus unshiu TaxID=55188 RepID=A0A2H5PUL0_CITUN|nr:hypothetical protein CUMW_168690 [Citrus unshiu]